MATVPNLANTHGSWLLLQVLLRTRWAACPDPCVCVCVCVARLERAIACPFTVQAYELRAMLPLIDGSRVKLQQASPVNVRRRNHAKWMVNWWMCTWHCATD